MSEFICKCCGLPMTTYEQKHCNDCLLRMETHASDMFEALEATVLEWESRGFIKYGEVGAPCSMFMVQAALALARGEK